MAARMGKGRHGRHHHRNDKKVMLKFHGVLLSGGRDESAGSFDELRNGVDADTATDVAEDIGALAAHALRVLLHDSEIRANVGRKVDFVHHQKVRPGNAGSALTWDLLAA